LAAARDLSLHWESATFAAILEKNPFLREMSRSANFCRFAGNSKWVLGFHPRCRILGRRPRKTVASAVLEFPKMAEISLKAIFEKSAARIK